MRISVVAAPGWMVAGFAGALALALPVRSEEAVPVGRTIYSLADEAACRDVNGRIELPRIVPTPPLAAENASLGMVKVIDSKVTASMKGRECFFYAFEVGLDPSRTQGSTSCPDASLGQEKSFIPGTRGALAGCSR
jgi:hypothetical protein